MPKIVVLPHPNLCPNGEVIEVPAGRVLCQSLIDNGIDVEHACGQNCACTTCHIRVREGGASLGSGDELEKDLLQPAMGFFDDSRLSCQSIMGSEDLVIEIPS